MTETTFDIGLTDNQVEMLQPSSPFSTLFRGMWEGLNREGGGGGDLLERGGLNREGGGGNGAFTV